jgi:hypothetical protein
MMYRFIERGASIYLAESERTITFFVVSVLK